MFILYIGGQATQGPEGRHARRGIDAPHFSRKEERAMDVNTLVTLIGSLGFPIVMCILLFRQSERQNERMDEQTAKTTEAITKLEKAITILTERLSASDVRED